MSKRRLLIAGCGDLGVRLAARLDARGQWQVTGLRRNIDRLPATIQAVRADLDRPESLEAIDRRWDAVIYTATPGERSPAAYRRAYLQGLRHLLDQVRTDRLVFCSSTAVYGQQRGEWVDEQSPAQPSRFNGEILLEAERLARASGGVVVRFSGIYGPGRDWLIRKLRSGEAACRRDPPEWTNRIHSEDCAAVLAYLIDLPRPDPLYLASDALPAPRHEVLAWLADRLGVAPPRIEPDQPGADQGKRVCAQKLRQAGFALQYPDYRSGYAQMLQ